MSFDILNRNGWAWRHGNDWRWPRLSWSALSVARKKRRLQ